MTVQETDEFGEKLAKRNGTVFLLREKPNADIGDIGGTIVPTTDLDELSLDRLPESFVDNSVLVNGETNREDGVITVEIEEAAPILVTVLDDGAFAPKIHGLESLERLRMRGKIAK